MPRVEFDLECDLSKKKHILFWILLTLVSQPQIPFTRYWIHYRNATVFCIRMWWCWNYNGQGHERNPAVQGETSVPRTLPTTNPTRTGLSRKPSLRVKKWAITTQPPPPTTPRCVWYYCKTGHVSQSDCSKCYNEYPSGLCLVITKV